MRRILLSAILLLALIAVSQASSGTDVIVEWNASTSADVASYCVYRAAPDATEASLVGETSHEELSFIDSGVPDGTWVWYATAKDTAGNQSVSSNSSEEIVVDNSPPDPPTNCTAREVE